MSANTGLRVDYADPAERDALLADPQVLALFGFRAGARPSLDTDPRWLEVGLQPYGQAQLEVWRSQHPAQHGRDRDLAWAQSADLGFGVLQVDEAEHGGIEAAACYAYQRLGEHLANSAHPRLLRIWNYMDAITLGEGDEERYRQFCVGRAAGIGKIDTQQLPAATAIGRCDGVRVFQLYWLCCNQPGTPLENPRQVSAYHYPRQYGRQAPSFARAMLGPNNVQLPLLLSGTASVVGHETRHAGQALAQIGETLTNLQVLIDTAREQRPQLSAQLGAGSRLKVYVTRAEEQAEVEAALSKQLDPAIPRMILHGTICRHDLMMEIDGVHQ